MFLLQWRDHWMQAIYYPLSVVTVATGEQLTIHSFHDEYSLWFDVSKPDKYVRPSYLLVYL